MTQDSLPDSWLIRTHLNVLAGPYSGDQVRALIQRGDLMGQDEVCRANHYWFYLHEREEILSQLGVNPPGMGRAEGEITETETVLSEKTDPEILELAETPNPDEESTSILSNRALREFKASQQREALEKVLVDVVVPQPTQIPARAQRPQPQSAVSRSGAPPLRSVVLGASVERSSLWRGVILVLLALGFVLFVWLIRILKA